MKIEALENQLQLVNFKLNSVEFAFNIMNVHEIIKYSNIRPLPRAPGHIKGVISLRNQILPIIDLKRTLFNSFDTNENESKQKIIVINHKEFRFGVLVDSVSQVFTLPTSDIEPPPKALDFERNDSVAGIGKLNKGERIFMILDPEKLIQSNDDFNELVQDELKLKNEEVQSQKSNETDEKLIVCFKINQEEYAINVLNVQEIIKTKSITEIPQQMKKLEGIINLRGNIVPIIDLKDCLGLKKDASKPCQRIVIVMGKNGPTGLMVDEVTEVTRIYQHEISPPPSSIQAGREEYLEGIGKKNQGKRVILLMNIEKLLRENHEENAA